MLSSLPLFASRDHRDPMNYSFRDILNRRYLKLGSIFALRGVSIVPAVFLFPLFVYYIGGSIDAGGISALKGVGSMLFALVLGKASDSFDRRKMIVAGLAASTVLFFARIFVTRSFQAFTISLLDGLTFMVFYIPFYSSLADMAEDEDVLEFYAFRELMLGVGKLLAVLPALYFALNASIMAGLKASFAAAGVSCLLLMIGLALTDIEFG
jgi:MFS family permease